MKFAQPNFIIQVVPVQQKVTEKISVTFLGLKATSAVKPKGGTIMKQKAVIAVTVLSVVFLLASAVNAGPSGSGFRERWAETGGLKALLELNLSEDQRVQLVALLDKYEEQRESLRNSIGGARRNVARILKAEPFDEENARKAFREASAVREDMFVLRAKMMFEIRGVLTPEQLQLLQDRRKQRHDRVKERLNAWSEVTGE